MKFKIQYRLVDSSDWFPVGTFYETWTGAVSALNDIKTRNMNDSRVADYRTVPVRGRK